MKPWNGELYLSHNTPPATVKHILTVVNLDWTLYSTGKMQNYHHSCKTVNIRENVWNIYCFATDQMQVKTVKDNC